MQRVELGQGVELRRCSATRNLVVGQIRDRLLQIRRPASPGRPRAESSTTTGRPLGRLGRADHHEPRQVLILATQAVKQPGADAGPRERLLAGVHLQAGAVVVDVVRHHRANHAQVVDMAGQVREQLADFDPALTVAGELEGRAQQVAGLGAFELRLVERQRTRHSRPGAGAWGRTGRHATGRPT